MMDIDYQKIVYSTTRARPTDAAEPVRRPVVVVGAGPVGLATAIDLAQQGMPVLAARRRQLAVGGIARHLLFQAHPGNFDRLGCGERAVEKGVSGTSAAFP
jgi:3-(3-hydroxy-phenyl)propionate hydroxylase